MQEEVAISFTIAPSSGQNRQLRYNVVWKSSKNMTGLADTFKGWFPLIQSRVWKVPRRI